MFSFQNYLKCLIYQKVAISGAPVTAWELYDTAYTERYMGIPEENKEAYYRGSVLSCAKAFPDE